MAEKTAVSLAVVTLFFADATGTVRTDIEVAATGATWVVEDLTIARNLKDQLTALLGDPYADHLLPVRPTGADRGLAETWPGSVTVEHDEPQ